MTSAQEESRIIQSTSEDASVHQAESSSMTKAEKELLIPCLKRRRYFFIICFPSKMPSGDETKNEGRRKKKLLIKLSSLMIMGARDGTIHKKK